KLSSEIGLLILPHHTFSSVYLSLTKNRSCGERPVKPPVLTANVPLDVSLPIFLERVICCSFSPERFQWTSLLRKPYFSSSAMFFGLCPGNLCKSTGKTKRRWVTDTDANRPKSSQNLRSNHNRYQSKRIYRSISYLGRGYISHRIHGT